MEREGRIWFWYSDKTTEMGDENKSKVSEETNDGKTKCN